MRKKYRLLAAPEGWPETLPFRVSLPGQPESYGIGEEFEHEFLPEHEAANLESGLLEVVREEAAA